jgi:hypothetical protein
LSPKSNEQIFFGFESFLANSIYIGNIGQTIRQLWYGTYGRTDKLKERIDSNNRK